MTEEELLKDCLRRLNTIGIAYMLTGSMASNAWTRQQPFAWQLRGEKLFCGLQ